MDEQGDLCDRELLARIQQRDPEALIALQRRYGGKVLALALRVAPDRYSAEEVVQDVFCRLWDKSNLFTAEKGSLLAWLLTIARNIALDLRRRESRRATFFVPVGMTEKTWPAAADPNRGGTDREQQQAIRQALETLPPAQRTVVEMLYFEGLTNAELSERLGEPLGTIKTRARLAMEKIRACLRPSTATETKPS